MGPGQTVPGFSGNCGKLCMHQRHATSCCRQQQSIGNVSQVAAFAAGSSILIRFLLKGHVHPSTLVTEPRDAESSFISDN